MSKKFVIGAMYKTREGRRVQCLSDQYRGCGGSYPYIFMEITGDDPAYYETLPDGTIYAGQQHGLDVVGEWREPVSISGWLNVYDGYQYFYPSRELADVGAVGTRRIACIYVSGTEGVEP